MRNIDKILYDLLFEKREVKISNATYNYMFDKIWPQYKNFEYFLLSSENTLKIEFAKKIYKSLILSNDVFIPSSLINEVLNDQYIYLTSKNDGYIAQDHFVHSINLYILGIYLIFNSKLIFKKLIKNNDGSNIQEIIEILIMKWQVFAFYHDVGYYFEPKNKRKNFSMLCDIKDTILQLQIIKNLTRFIVYKSIFETSKEFNYCFDSSKLLFKQNIYYDFAGNVIDKKTLISSLSQFNGALWLKGINNENDIDGIYQLINDRKILTAVYDENNLIIAIVIRDGEEIKDNSFFSKNSTEDILFGNRIYPLNSNYELKYFMVNSGDNQFFHRPIISHAFIDDVYSKLSNELKTTLNFKKTQDYAYAVFDWLYDLINNEVKDFTSYQDKNNLKCQKEVLVSFLLKQIQKIEVKPNYSNINEIFEKLKESINIQKFIEKAAKLYDKNFGSIFDLLEEYKTEFDKIYNLDAFKNLTSDLNFFTKQNNKYNLVAFNHNDNNTEQNELYKEIKDKSLKLNINWDKLKTYKMSKVSYDHGVVSASLLYKVAEINECLYKVFSEENFGCLSFGSLFKEQKSRFDAIADTIFAVLLHNVYCLESGEKGAIDYRQDINLNSFSYFCSFCDVLQKWGRTKQINLAHTSLPNLHLLEEDFNITLDNEGYITIWCLKKYDSYMKNMIYDAETYLPGFTSIVKIKCYN